ncbi:hypothetical protein SNOG_04166 [Parastagonospora nodorum SN15]|uniref:Uncharacterized protein n=1 Tax=Phaeosphaeria nodorum (strain SN15 / ATCC MYA-4574 / FGSC 10173) TaxID=321614 RepID=Q0UVP8_PHANO|nr:hypothetical protein SNOG_04166 [Parastagonospora nodorum SN15]EAT87926.1 hypothetical protein SNOG_04166 [Parastagonospora nodorum SN15]
MATKHASDAVAGAKQRAEDPPGLSQAKALVPRYPMNRTTSATTCVRHGYRYPTTFQVRKTSHHTQNLDA